MFAAGAAREDLSQVLNGELADKNTVDNNTLFDDETHLYDECRRSALNRKQSGKRYRIFCSSHETRGSK